MNVDASYFHYYLLHVFCVYKLLGLKMSNTIIYYKTCKLEFVSIFVIIFYYKYIEILVRTFF
jgi:hypothetical protein